MIGASATGKTTLMRRFIDSIFDVNTQLTLGVNLLKKNLENGATLQIWDIGGQKSFFSLAQTYFIGTTGLILVVDNQRSETFNTDGWKELFWKTGQDVPTVLALNKVDLDIDLQMILDDTKIINSPLKWVVEREIPIIKTSAKTGDGVDDLYFLLTNMIIDKLNLYLDTFPINMENLFYVPRAWNEKKRKKLNLIPRTSISVVNKISERENERKIVLPNVEKLEEIISNVTELTELKSEVNKLILKYRDNENLQDSLKCLLEILYKNINNKIKINNQADILFLFELIKTSDWNKTNENFQLIAGYSYFLLGIYYSSVDLNKSGKIFFESFIILYNINKLLASKAFLLSCAYSGYTDYDFFINQLLINQKPIQVLLETMRENLLNSVEKLSPSDYVSVGLAIINALDATDNDLDVLNPIQDFLKFPTEEIPLNEYIHEAMEDTMNLIDELVNVRIISIRIFPEMLMNNLPLYADVTLQNITKREKTCIIQMISPGAEIERDNAKIRIPKKSNLTVRLVAGRPQNYGNLVYYFEITDLDGFRKNIKEHDFYIAHPNETIRIQEVKYESDTIKEGLPFILGLKVVNLGNNIEKCLIKVRSADFKTVTQDYLLKLDKNSTQDQRIELGEPQHSGKIRVNLILYKGDKEVICDQRILNFKAKRSWTKVIKKGFKVGFDITTSIL